jgi:acyl carrier protein
MAAEPDDSGSCADGVMADGAAPTPTPAPRVRAGPSDGYETMLAEIWSDVLGANEIGGHDNFLDLGGNSLAALRIVARVYEATGVKVPTRALFDRPTLVGMAALVKQFCDTGTVG